MNDIPWAGSPALLAHWQQGTTGFPIVDAGMRELSETGYMHNRVRMITASFLVKNLHINWQAGETHFARHLIDHDPSLNNGNWQWAASTGCDAQPWFRIFNPWRQQKRFDPQCEYIRQWIPELSEQPASVIHGLEHSDAAYLPKVVDLKESASQFKDMIRSIKAR
jgi:deoxyribodipyrimidine photo-lyase